MGQRGRAIGGRRSNKRTRKGEQEALSRECIQISSSDGRHIEAVDEGCGDFAPAVKGDVDRVVSSMEQLTQKLDVIAEYILTQSPSGTNKTISTKSPGPMQERLFTPPSIKKADGKVLQTVQSPTGYYIGKSLPNARSPVTAAAQTFGCPWWLSTLFNHVREMRFTVEELAVAGYIFGTSGAHNLDPNEVLVRTVDGLEIARRSTLNYFLPGKMIDDDILNLVACMLTEEERLRSCDPEFWFMPTFFAQYADSWRMTPEEMAEEYGYRFMCVTDSLKKIFIPVNEDNLHWFLVVVDLETKEIIILDSFPSIAQPSARKFKLQKLMLYLQDFLRTRLFVSKKIELPVQPSEFMVVVPNGLPTQELYSNDCGIFVAFWMITYQKNDYIINVDDSTRLFIALDLVMKGHNGLSEAIKSNALQHSK